VYRLARPACRLVKNEDQAQKLSYNKTLGIKQPLPVEVVAA